MDRFERQRSLKQKIREGTAVSGLFIKIPSPQIVELLAGTQFDCLVLDAEHSAFGVESLDRCLLAAHLTGIPTLVRVPDIKSDLILKVLDMGAAGVILPHIRNREEAEQAVAVTRYRGGERGFSAAHRSAGYGALPVNHYRQLSDDATIVIGQIEDVAAVENISEIMTVSQIDAFFIGCADLSVSYGVDLGDDPRVNAAVDMVCSACQKAKRTTAVYLASADQYDDFRSKGVSLFFVSSDQALLSRSAKELSDTLRAKNRP